MGSPSVGTGDGTKHSGGKDCSGGMALECDSTVSMEGQNVPVGNDEVAESASVHSVVECECDIDSAGCMFKALLVTPSPAHGHTYPTL